MPRLLLSFASFLIENEGRLNFIKKQKHNQAISFRHDTEMATHLRGKMNGHAVTHVEIKQMGEAPDERPTFEEAPSQKQVDEWEKEASHHIIDHIAAHDPSPKKIHTEWMVNQYKKENFRHEDLPRMQEWLGYFQTYKPRLKADGRSTDINSYKHPADMEAAVRPYVNLDMASSKSKELERIKKEGVDIVHNANGLRVEKLKTQEAACALHGHDTRWCTSSRNNNMFHQYSNQGPLYVVHTPDKRKYQFHFESNQFADENDKMHKPEDLVRQYPELKNVKAFKEYSDSKDILSDHLKFTTRLPFLHDNEKEELFDKVLSQDKKLGSLGKFSLIRGYIAKHGTMKHHKILMNDNASNVQKEVALNSNNRSILRHLTQSRFVQPREISSYRLEREFTGEKIPLVSPKLKKGTEMHLKALSNAHQYHRTAAIEYRRSPPGASYQKSDGSWITYDQLGNWHSNRKSLINDEYRQHFPHIANKTNLNTSAGLDASDTSYLIHLHRQFNR